MSDAPIYIVDRDATLEEAPACAARVMQWMEDEDIAVPALHACVAFSPVSHAPGPNAAAWADWMNHFSDAGIGAEIGYQVFHSCAVETMQCPRCGTEHQVGGLLWSDAVNGWYSGEDDSLGCPACRQSSSVTDWQFMPLSWGFGNLAFGFDGPGAGEQLADAIGKLLGHRMVVVYQKI